MTIEDMRLEEERIGKLLEKALPGTTEYKNLQTDLLTLKEARLAEEKAEDDRLDRNWKHELEEERLMTDEKIAEIRSGDSRHHDIWEGLKTAGIIVGSIIGLLLTGELENDRILNSKCLQWIIKPR